MVSRISDEGIPQRWYAEAVSPPRLMICPFCGHTQRPAERCQDCGTAFDAAARKATIARMGPWFVRDPERSFLPGCTYDALRELVQEGRVGRYTIVRGPTTRQLWTVARHVPGLAHLLGYCHACDAPVNPDDEGCYHCGASFTAPEDGDSLGLGEGEASSRSTAPGRSVGFVPTRGLSAFASDEELLESPVPRGGSRESAALAPGSAVPSMATMAPVTPLRPVETRAAEASTDEAGTYSLHASIERSLRATLRRQRLLSGILLGLVIALFAASAWLFVRMRGLELRAPELGGTADESRAAGAPAEVIPSAGAVPDGSGPVVGQGSHRDADQRAPAAPEVPAPRPLEAIAQAIEALAADRSADPDTRRARLIALEAELDSRTRGQPAGPSALTDELASIRQRLNEVKAQIELDAVLPPQ